MAFLEEGDLIYDTDNDRTFLVEAKYIPDMWSFLDLKANESLVFTELQINDCFNLGFWRFTKTS